MDDSEKIIAICWLDSGVYQAKAVADRFGMTVIDLEADLAAFKTHADYAGRYASFVNEKTQPLLADTPFPEWDGNCAVRVLKNRRIECVVCLPEKDKYYHFYIPEKAYLDHICDYSRWLPAQQFRSELSRQQVEDWCALPAADQVRFLAQRYDTDIYIPFCLRVDKEQAATITGQQVPGDRDWTISDTSRQFQPANTTLQPDKQATLRSLNTDLPLEERSRRDSEIKELTHMLLNDGFSYEWEGNTVECELEKSEQEAALTFISASDSARLSKLAAKGPGAVEKGLLFKIDPFYSRYGLVQAIKNGIQTGDFAPLRKLAQEAFDRIAEQNAECKKAREAEAGKPGQPVPDGVKTPSGQSLSNEAWNKLDTFRNLGYDEDAGLALQELGKLLDSLGRDGVQTVRQQYEKEFKDQIPSEIAERVQQLLDEASKRTTGAQVTSPSGMANAPSPETGPGTAEQTAAAASDPQPKPNPVEQRWEQLRQQRQLLLDTMRLQGLTEDLVTALGETERLILKVPAGQRPAFYPEEDAILYKLYLGGMVRTELAVSRIIMSRLTPAQVNELFNHLNDKP